MRRVAPAPTFVILFATLVGLACADPTTAPESAASFAKGGGGGGVSVQSTMPSRTEPGTTLDVRVLGSGFDAGTRVSFALGGVATSKIVTNGTKIRVVVSPSRSWKRYHRGATNRLSCRGS